jgi:hypothetical protein
MSISSLSNKYHIIFSLRRWDVILQLKLSINKSSASLMSEFPTAILSFFKETLISEYLDLSVGNLRYLFFLDVTSCYGVMYMNISPLKNRPPCSWNFGHQSLSDAVPHRRRTKTSSANAFSFGLRSGSEIEGSGNKFCIDSLTHDYNRVITNRKFRTDTSDWMLGFWN